MANLHAIHSVGSSIVKYLKNSYPDDLRHDFSCDFQLVGSAEINDEKKMEAAVAVTLFLHRVAVNPHVRNTPHVDAQQRVGVPLSIDLSYLLTVWAPNALTEQTILGWVVRQLYMHQTLSHSDLTPDGGWGPGDFVQVIPSEIPNEELMRIWDALDPGYRLSLSYVARVVRIDADFQADAQPVVAKRLQFAKAQTELGG